MTETTDLPPAPEAPQGTPSEIPRPPRNWRGYTKEYLVIVVGVLTALAAHQMADWLLWRSEVASAPEGARPS